ncbi:MAG: MATE family efflux transporter [Synergistaceae bacterium]|nr:MATE family efflux transporter [Synergistaceae bacterium]
MLIDEEKIPKLLIHFAMPAMVGMVAGAIYNIVDRIFVGRYVGTSGLAAITLSFPVMLLMFSFSLLIGVGGSSRIAILRGAKKQRPAEQALGHTLMLLAAVGFAGMGLSVYGVDMLLRISGASEEILPLARNYLRIILIGGPLALMGHGINSLIRACGNPRYAMGTQILGAFSNILLDALFIVKMGMGVEGAALGTVMAQGAATVCGLMFFYSGSSPLRIRLHFLVRMKMKVIKKIFAVGSSPFITELSFVFYMTLMNNMVRKYGGDIGLSAMGVFLSLDSILFLPALAIGEAVQPVIGYNYGAGKPDRVIMAIKYAIKMVTCFYILSFVVAEIFAEKMILLFNDDPELLAIGVPGMRIAYVGIIFMGVTIITNSALLGLGRAREAITLSVFRHAVFLFLPLIILPRFFGLWGIWMSFPVGDISGCLIAALFLMRLFNWLKGDSAIFSD